MYIYIYILSGPENVQVERIVYDQKGLYKSSHASSTSLWFEPNDNKTQGLFQCVLQVCPFQR